MFKDAVRSGIDDLTDPGAKAMGRVMFIQPGGGFPALNALEPFVVIAAGNGDANLFRLFFGRHGIRFLSD
jgi:hypothetical protein